MNIRKFDNIEMEFLDRGILRGGTLMFKKDEAIRFIDRCREKNYPIYGLDGFFITENTTQPSMEHSLDFELSCDITEANRYDAAIDFIKNQPVGMYFEVVHDASTL